MKFPLGAMSVGDVLDRGLKLLFARLPLFYAINLTVLAPLIVVQVVFPLLVNSSKGPTDPAFLMASMGLLLVSVALALVLQPIGTAAMLRVVMEEYGGRRPTLGEAFRFALTRFAALLGTSILVGLIVFAGFLLCIAPGVYFLVSYIFVAQVVVLEKLSGGTAMSRSQELISGHRGRVFGLLILIWVAMMAVNMGVGIGLNLVLPSQTLVPAERGYRVEINPVNHAVNTLISQLIQILFSTYIAVCTTLLYLDTRIRKEGFDLELAAQLGEEPDAEADRDRRDDRDAGWAESGDRPAGDDLR